MTLPTIAGVQSRIHTLTGHPPFMLKDDLAEFYGTTASNLMRRVRENISLFTPDTMIELTPEEYVQSCRGSTTAERKRTDLAQFGFTELGALMVATVLRSDRAKQVMQVVIRAFITSREAKITALQSLALKDEAAYLGRSPMRAAIKLAAEKGWTFGQLWGAHDWSQPRLGRAVEEMRARGYIAADALFVPAYVLMGRNYERVLLDMHAEDARQVRLGLEG